MLSTKDTLKTKGAQLKTRINEYKSGKFETKKSRLAAV
jgi:hypothetical protein